MCLVLERGGWTLARINGSHRIYRHAATGRRVVVPVHGNQDLKSERNAASCATRG
jgi:predicted RNA binding protein YcfA (HicA-like mRNA interferase family)